jgi:hypothetical protein
MTNGRSDESSGFRVPLELSEGYTSREAQLWEARRAFFIFALGDDPTIYSSLFPTPEEFEQLDRAPQRGPYHEWTSDRLDFLRQWLDLRGYESLEAFIAEWQDRYGLRDQWCAETAKSTMKRDWPYLEKEEPPWPFSICSMEIPVELPEVLEVPIVVRWLPWYESRADFLKRVPNEVRRQLKEVENDLPKGLPPSKDPLHLWWLSKVVIKGMSRYAIAVQMCPEATRDTDEREWRKNARRVSKAVQETAEMIGLTLPSDARRKSRSHSGNPPSEDNATFVRMTPPDTE